MAVEDLGAQERQLTRTAAAEIISRGTPAAPASAIPEST